MTADDPGSTDGKVLVSDEKVKLRFTDGKVIDTLFENVYGITLSLDVGTDLGYLYRSFDGYNDSKIEGILLGGSMKSTYVKALESDEGIKLGCSDGKVIFTIFGDVDGIILGIDVGTDLGSLDGSFDG